jgi:membrane associated rhomboid family serine protease
MTFPAPVTSAAGKEVKRKADVIPDNWRQAVAVPGAMIAVMVLVQLASLFWANLVNVLGIQPRTLSGLVGIVTAPFVHLDWQHLVSNAIPFLIFGFLVMVHGVKQFVAVTAVIWLVSGFGVWLTAPSDSVVIGASGIVFGWLAYLLARGIFNRNVWQILLGVVLFLIWGGMFWGVLPGASGISWQGHLFGSLGGVLAAFLAAKADGPRRPAVAAAPQTSFQLPS